MDFNLEQRLAWLQPGHFTFDKQVTVLEKEEGGLVNMLAICGVLGITEVSEVIVYTAFQNLSMDPTTSANPALLKMPVGGNTPTELQQWQHNKVHIQGKVFKHVPVQLDANGTGELSV